MAAPTVDPTLIAFLEGAGANYWTNQYVFRYYLSTIRAFELVGGKISYFEGMAATWLPGVGQMEPFEQNLLEAVYFDLWKGAWYIKGNLEYPELTNALDRATEDGVGSILSKPAATGKVKVRRVSDIPTESEEPADGPASKSRLSKEEQDYITEMMARSGFTANFTPTAYEKKIARASEETDPEFLYECATEGTWTVRTAVASNPNTPAYILALMPHGNKACHLALAKNPKTPAKVLAQFMNDSSRPVRDAVFANPNMTADMRWAMVKDPSPVIAKHFITSGATMPEEVWMHWANARLVETRLDVAESEDAPLSVIQFLTGSSNPHVREWASENLAERLENGENFTQ